jgi:hypothetical protein
MNKKEKIAIFLDMLNENEKFSKIKECLPDVAEVLTLLCGDIEFGEYITNLETEKYSEDITKTLIEIFNEHEQFFMVELIEEKQRLINEELNEWKNENLKD